MSKVKDFFKGIAATSRHWCDRMIDAFRSWSVARATLLKSRLSDRQFLIILSLIVGLLAGIAASILKLFINFVAREVTGFFPASQVNYLLLIVPVVGILLCGIYCRYIARANFEHGTRKIMGYLTSGNYDIPSKVTYGPMISAAITLGFGGSAGSEGPIAYTGAALGSNLGKYFHLSPDTLRLLVIIGAGAGIAGIFKAPIGGALYSLEVLGMAMTTTSVIALICGSLMAAAVAYAGSGFSVDVQFYPKDYFEPSMILPIILLGIFCGAYSAYYAYFRGKTAYLFGRISNPWVKNLISGSLIALLLFLFPALYGEGYGVIGHIINGNNSDILNDSPFYGLHGKWVLVAFTGGILAVKSIAASATNSGGGVGGGFAPTLYAGCIAGLFFSCASNTFFGTSLCEADFALYGMAAVMAGAIRAPLMAIFLTAEMVGDFSMFFPLSISAMVSYGALRFIPVSKRVFGEIC